MGGESLLTLRSSKILLLDRKHRRDDDDGENPSPSSNRRRSTGTGISHAKDYGGAASQKNGGVFCFARDQRRVAGGAGRGQESDDSEETVRHGGQPPLHVVLSSPAKLLASSRKVLVRKHRNHALHRDHALRATTHTW
eukprot:m.378113 g.378113  ORF g.378113 m.378113 type:complete len:138 (+) comp28211_c3_seq11:402-815(+)